MSAACELRVQKLSTKRQTYRNFRVEKKQNKKKTVTATISTYNVGLNASYLFSRRIVKERKTLMLIRNYFVC